MNSASLFCTRSPPPSPVWLKNFVKYWLVSLVEFVAVFGKQNPSRLLARFFLVTRLFYSGLLYLRSSFVRHLCPVRIVFRFNLRCSCGVPSVCAPFCRALFTQRTVPFVAFFFVCCSAAVSIPSVLSCHRVLRPLLGNPVSSAPFAAPSCIGCPMFPYFPSLYPFRHLLRFLAFPFLAGHTH